MRAPVHSGGDRFPCVELRLLAVLAVLAVTWAAVAAEGDPSAYDQALERYRAGRYEGVIHLLEAEAGLDAGESNLLGWAYLRTARTAEAVAAFRTAVSLQPGDFDSHCGLGHALLRSGDVAAAAASFSTGADGAPGDVECRLALARTLHALGRADEAADSFRLALESDPGNAEATRKLELLAPPSSAGSAVQEVEYLARGDYFWRRAPGAPPEPVYVKGVNLSFGVPGRYLTEFPYEPELYLKWFRLISEMNANVIRVYTILPPAFYRALHEFNRGKPTEDRLLLIQGIWSVLPEHDDFREPGFLEEVRSEIRNAVDVVHGNVDLPQRYGHAHGVYRADVSHDVLAWIFGREWEPAAASAYIAEGHGTEYRGKYVSIRDANALECWLAEMLDLLAGHEIEEYGVQRPLAWMNWPPLDPLEHPSEATHLESLEIRRARGEHVVDNVPPSEIYDNDAASVDETKLLPEPGFRAGVFASHHIYPYYPDFLKNDPRYAEDPEGYYMGYLRQMKDKYSGIPLLVSEYGVPTSRAVARFHPEGMHHGGHTEQRQAEVLRELTADIFESGCAGGILFEWIDEWIKRNWMVAGTEDRDRVWYNAMDPEESYGLLAMRPEKVGKLEGDPDSWSDASLLHQSEPVASGEEGADGALRLRRLHADADAGYLYLRLEIGGEPDWEDNAYLLAIDTFGDREGDHRLPFDLGLDSEVGFEFVVLIHGENSSLLVDDRYNRAKYDPAVRRWEGLSGYEENRDFRLTPNGDGLFEELVTKHRRRFGRDGTVFPEQLYRASPLKHGRPSEDCLADWYLDRHDRTVELRIPWGMLYFSDPSRRELMYSEGERRATEGIRVLAVSYRPRSAGDPTASGAGAGARVVDTLPAHPSGMIRFAWDGWDTFPQHVAKLKRAYHAMREMYRTLEPDLPAVALPDGFDFSDVIREHYGSVGEFLALPEVKRNRMSGNRGGYGAALGNLVKGFATGNPFWILEAEYLFRILRNRLPGGPVRDLAMEGARYARSVLEGGPDATVKTEKDHVPVRIDRNVTAPGKFRRIVLGATSIRVEPGEEIRTQVDRVSRDWLSGVNFGASPWEFSADRGVSWHEGARIRELLEYVDAEVRPVWGTRARKIGDRWYTPDAEGVYRFEITPDKVHSYPTNLVLGEREVILNDTHGISALAWDSAGADLVVGCGDHPGKIEAAYWLAERGVDVYMPTDRYLGMLIGTRTDGVILGSAPIRRDGKAAVIGDRQVAIDSREPIVVSDTNGMYPMQYYDTPRRYFRDLESFVGRKLKIVPVNVPAYGKVSVVVDRAREIGARVIGVRVAEEEEREAVSSWLLESPEHRAVLFHTAAYDPGYRLFSEFPRQTTFGDIYPRFEKR